MDQESSTSERNGPKMVVVVVGAKQGSKEKKTIHGYHKEWGKKVDIKSNATTGRTKWSVSRVRGVPARQFRSSWK